MRNLRIRKSDLILISGLLIIALIFGGIWILTRDAGGVAVVVADGQEVQRLPLNRDTEIVIGDEKHYNVVVVKDGKVYVSEASCPDRVCVNKGKVCYEGETIVCLPNKLIVKIEGGEKSSVDDVSQ